MTLDRMVVVRGGEVWTEDSGPGRPTVVLLHPGWGDSTIWDPLLDRLGSGYRVIRYDVRGHGRSPAPTTDFTHLDDLVDVLDQLAVRRAIVIGHSGGGATAIGLALSHPALVSGLILVAPGVADYPWPEDDPYFLDFAALYSAGDRDGLRSLALRTWAAAGAGPDAVAQVDSGISALFAQGNHLCPDPPAFERLPEIGAPTDVLLGNRDHPMIQACADAIVTRVPGARLIPVPGADHLLPLRAPGVLADILEQHRRGHQPKR